MPGGPWRSLRDDGRLQLLSAEGGTRASQHRRALACPTAVAFDPGGTALYVCQGIGPHRASDWAVDLMEKNASGSVWRYDLASGARACLPPTLPFPMAFSYCRTATASPVEARELAASAAGIPAHGGGVEPLLSKLPAIRRG